MKKEKQVRSYKRRTKSGKVVTVKAHTAKYDAAEKAKEVAKEKGAGKELEAKRNKMPNPNLPMNEYLDEWKKRQQAIREEVTEEDSTKKSSEKKEKEKKVRPVGSGTNGPTPKKKSKAGDTKVTASKTSEPAFTAAEFKEWYRGTGSAADKKVAKALRAQLGRAGYRKLEDEAIDNYSSRGHLSMFKRVGTMESPEQKEKRISQQAESRRKKATSDLHKQSMSNNSLYKENGVTHRQVLSKLKSQVAKNGVFTTKDIEDALGWNTKRSKAFNSALKKITDSGIRTTGRIKEELAKAGFDYDTGRRISSTKSENVKTSKKTTKAVSVDDVKQASSIHGGLAKLGLREFAYGSPHGSYTDYQHESGKLFRVSNSGAVYDITPTRKGKRSSTKTEKAAPKGKKGGSKEPLTSYHKHAINALLNQPGWSMSKAEKYVRTLSAKEVQRLAHKDM